MNRLNLILISLVLIIGFGTANAQAPDAIIKGFGVSPRDVAMDEEDIFDRASSSLLNVGIGEAVYLSGNLGDEDITAWEWSMEVPEDSETELTATDVEIIGFVPDMIGTFLVTLIVTSDSGQSEPASVPVNVSTYVGSGGIVGDAEFPQCGTCHGDHLEAWATTNHSIALTKGLDGEKGEHFRSYCVSCHSTGYDSDERAANNGFDDRAAEDGWEFPDSLYEGGWDHFVENYPNVAQMGNIQCEMCHGPGDAHRSNVADNRIAVSYEIDACAKCHDAGTYHTFPYSWDFSGHANSTRYPTGAGRESCVRCHGGYGFIDYVNGVPQEERRTDYLPITCVTCHDPHTNENDNHQLRITEPYTLENGVEVDFGLGNLCVNCHHSRRNAEEYVQEYHRHYGPHHSNQGDMIRGTNAIEYGEQFRIGPHSRQEQNENVCVSCHMAPGPGQDEAGYLEIGTHSFAMENADGVQNVAACAECHGEIESFSDIPAGADYDLDGTVETVTEEINALMEELAMMLPPIDEADVSVDTNYTLAQLSAAYNYFYVEDDGSHGVHNGPYSAGILRLAIRSLLSVPEQISPIPQGWAMGSAYPNPFNPSTTFTYSVAVQGDLSIKLYNMAGREVAEVVTGNQPAGVFRTTIDMSGKPSGVYIIRMVSEKFNATQKVVLMK